MGFRVTPEDLHTLGSHYSQHASDLEQTHQQLVSKATGIESVWQGGAAEQHHQLMQQYNSQLAQLKDTLHQISQNVHTAADNYAHADESAHRGFMS
ncbi:MAG TPA: WXG100 family type VII secretion target [Ktedonobacterales bacterium]|jgi:WXG100 family type VII secretion target|nr:WXG100 family type VII secretion target [Ktedonobacterales bacterium]